MLNNILTDFALYVDGNLCLAEVEEVKLPTLTTKVEEFEAGGMLSAIDVPMGAIEKMESEMTFHTFNPDVLGDFGIYPGAKLPITLRGSMVDINGTKKPVKATMQGLFSEVDIDAFKAHQKVQIKLKYTPTYYKLEINNSVIHEVDVLNYVMTVNGVDLAAEVRNHLGI